MISLVKHPTVTTTKLVEFAYPSSPRAIAHRFGTTGCYTVNTWTVDGKGLFKSETHGAYETKEEAELHAEAMPHEWNRLYLLYPVA